MNLSEREAARRSSLHESGFDKVSDIAKKHGYEYKGSVGMARPSDPRSKQRYLGLYHDKWVHPTTGHQIVMSKLPMGDTMYTHHDKNGNQTHGDGKSFPNLKSLDSHLSKVHGKSESTAESNDMPDDLKPHWDHYMNWVTKGGFDTHNSVPLVRRWGQENNKPHDVVSRVIDRVKVNRS